MFICVCCVPVTAPTETNGRCLKTKTARIAENTWRTKAPFLVTMAGHEHILAALDIYSFYLLLIIRVIIVIVII